MDIYFILHLAATTENNLASLNKGVLENASALFLSPSDSTEGCYEMMTMQPTGDRAKVNTQTGFFLLLFEPPFTFCYAHIMSSII